MDIRLEQLVYGSFPFWDRGYDVLARSPACRAEWVSDVLAACQRIGEAPSGVTPSPALFALPLPSGPWAVVGVEPQGQDDRGRPGALAFHALLVEPRDYRKAGSDPFAFAGALRQDWSAGSSLDALIWTVEPRKESSLPGDPRARRVVEALVRGKRVALESPTPIDGLAREVWPALPDSTRRRASVATWAFGNANRFGLVALPRLSGIELDGSYIDPASIDAGPPEPAETPASLPLYRGGWFGPSSRRALAVAALTVVVAAGLAWRAWDGPEKSTDPAPAPAEPGPSVDRDLDPRAFADLANLANRFEIGASKDPGELMAKLAERAHYRGPFLNSAELARLAAEHDPDRDRALAWDRRLRSTFADDRPLPDDFARLPLPRQLDRLAWSFHLDPSTRPEDVPRALLEALAREGPIRPTPLAARYPALSDYARFLARLPRFPAENEPVASSQPRERRRQ